MGPKSRGSVSRASVSRASVSRLGQGIDALFPVDPLADLNDYAVDDVGETDTAPPGTRPDVVVLQVPLDKLKANPGQPRKHFDEESLQELADSIREQGIIQPLLVEDAGNGTWTIVAGERRSRAARLAGLTEVPAIIRNYSDEKRLEVSLIENVQRADLNPMEEASAYRALMELTGLSQDEVAAKVGKNRSTVANALRLLKLLPAARDCLEKGTLTPGHGRAILSVDGEAAQERLLGEILRQGLSVREAEKRAAALNAGNAVQPAAKPAASRRDPELGAMEDRFRERLGTKVTIHGDMKKGSISIDYYSMEDLERLLEILG
ncbi:chromosome partitioning protein ParB [Spirochaetia bacterium]|nr:chromosome partitioning protein ParB [Spirochaetia bacterium]